MDSKEKTIKIDKREFILLKKLKKSKFSLFLTSTLEDSKKIFALKVFPNKKKSSQKAYENEARFQFLDHPNIIEILNAHPTVAENLKLHFTKDDHSILMNYESNGNFGDFIMQGNLAKDETLVRTYFHQLINAIEYIHSKGVSHLDLKPDNLLIGKDFRLILCDFDSSHLETDSSITALGTENYRAPEILEKNCVNPFKADIYSAGLILFQFMTGFAPYSESIIIEDLNFYNMILNENDDFWQEHSSFTHTPLISDMDFKSLIKSMLKTSVSNRANLKDVKDNVWYNCRTYTVQELKEKMAILLS